MGASVERAGRNEQKSERDKRSGARETDGEQRRERGRRKRERETQRVRWRANEPDVLANAVGEPQAAQSPLHLTGSRPDLPQQLKKPVCLCVCAWGGLVFVLLMYAASTQTSPERAQLSRFGVKHLKNATQKASAV